MKLNAHKEQHGQRGYDDGANRYYVGWDYANGLSTSDNGNLPLLVTNGAFATLPSMRGAGAVPIDIDSNLWGDKGVVFLFLGQNAEFVKATGVGSTYSIGKPGEPVISDTVTIPASAALLVAR